MAKKTNILRVYVLLLICFLAMPIVLLLLLRAPICSGKLFPSSRSYIELFCPPADLYRSVLDEKINISAIDKPYTFKFKLKYIGSYFVCIAMYGLDDKLYGTEYDLKLRIKVNFFKDNVLLSSLTPTDYYNKSWVSARGEGKIVGEFESPKDIPIDTNITCEVIILSADPYLASHCKEPSIVIVRRSEE